MVGVGASAGGLEAFSELLKCLPPDPGLAIVLVQHLELTHHSDLAEVLSRKAQMPVVQVETGMSAQPGHVYVIPPNTEMHMRGDQFSLSPRPTGAAPSLTVDVFLTSLAEDRGNRAIGVILSGTASDGTKGLAAIRAGGGTALVQTPQTARHSGVPESAIAAGVADAVLCSISRSYRKGYRARRVRRTAAAPGLFRRLEDRGLFARLPGDTPRFAFGDRPLSAARIPVDDATLEVPGSENEREWNDAQRQLDEMLVSRYAPAALLIHQDLRARQVRGAAGDYLRFRPGEASLDLSTTLSAGLGMAVTSAIDEARETQRTAHREAVQPRAEGGHEAVDIAVIPMPSLDATVHYAVLFDEGATVSRAPGEPGAEPAEAEYLRQELDAATERLRILRYGRDAANESLRAANEEVQSDNEELQSMNEELETAREELQSTNEELITLDEELRDRAEQLSHRNSDLNALLSSASIAMLLLDGDLTIRRYTAEAAYAFNLIPGDIGRRHRHPLATGHRGHRGYADIGDRFGAAGRTPSDR